MGLPSSSAPRPCFSSNLIPPPLGSGRSVRQCDPSHRNSGLPHRPQSSPFLGQVTKHPTGLITARHDAGDWASWSLESSSRHDSNGQGMINGAGWGWISGWKRPSSWRQWFGLAVAARPHPSRSAPTAQDFGKAKSGMQSPVLAGQGAVQGTPGSWGGPPQPARTPPQPARKAELPRTGGIQGAVGQGDCILKSFVLTVLLVWL